MAKVEDSLPPTPAPRMMATSGDTDDMAKGTNLCKGSLLFFFLKKKTSIDEHLWCAKYYAKEFTCIVSLNPLQLPFFFYIKEY